jgi:hypothetical protein
MYIVRPFAVAWGGEQIGTCRGTKGLRDVSWPVPALDPQLGLRVAPDVLIYTYIHICIYTRTLPKRIRGCVYMRRAAQHNAWAAPTCPRLQVMIFGCRV